MIRIANAPCSWGVLEFDLAGETVDYRQFLDELVATGYAGTELGDWGFMPTDPEALGGELRARNVALVGAFVPMALADPARHEEGIRVGERTGKLMAAAGFPEALVVLADDNGTVAARTNSAGRVTPDTALDADGWRHATDAAARFARRVRDACGLRTVFHHHCAGYVETPAEIEKLLASTPEDTLGLVLDTGHYRFAGGYPEAALRLFGDRIRHVHYKDCSAQLAQRSCAEGWDYFTSVGKGVFCELGTGTVDFAAITAELTDRGYDGWIVVEQDVLPGMGSPKATAGRNRAFLTSLGL